MNRAPDSEQHLSSRIAASAWATAPVNEPAGYADELEERAIRADKEWADDDSDEIPW